MLLRVGIASMAFALTFTLVAVILVKLSGAEETPPMVAEAEPQAAETPVGEDEFDTGENLELDIEPTPKPEEVPPPAETPAPVSEPENVGTVEAIEQPPPKPPEEPPAQPQEEPTPEPEPQVEPPEEPQEEPPTQPQEEPAPQPKEEVEEEPLPLLPEDLPPPTQEEVAAASKPRYYPWVEGAVFTLTIRALEIYNAPVLDSTSPEALANGVVHIPETPMPWDGGQQKNVYLAGHRVGVPGTTSRVLFYHLDKISVGDSIVLKDRSGNAYRYRVSEVFVVTPADGWVLDPVRDRHMVTLQTCTYPTFENRLIVRADEV